MSAFDAEVDAMLADVRGHVDRIVRNWLINVGDFLAVATPGPGNQYDGTSYVAKGVLRMAYNWSNAVPPAVASGGGEGSPGDDTYEAEGVKAKLEAQVRDLKLTPELWLWNNAFYAEQVHDGLDKHQHIGRREFLLWAQNRSEGLLEIAIAEA